MEVNQTLINNTLPVKAFTSLFHNMFDAIVIYNYETEKIKNFNRSFSKLLQYEDEKLYTLNRFDLMPRFSSLYPDICLLYTSPSPRDATLSRMPSSA